MEDNGLKKIIDYEIPLDLYNQFNDLNTNIDDINAKGFTAINDSKISAKLTLGYLQIMDFLIENGTYLLNFENKYAGNGSILVCKFSKDGSLLWNKKLPKEQLRPESNLHQNSYSFVNRNGFYYYFLIDNAKNLNLDSKHSPEKVRALSGGQLLCYKINAKDGETVKIPIMDLNKVSITAKPKALKQSFFTEISKAQYSSTLGCLFFESYLQKEGNALFKLKIE